MSKIAAPLVLMAGDRERLQAVLRASTAAVSLVTRARIVLLAADGLSNAQIARQVGVSGPTVLLWRTVIAVEVLGRWGIFRGLVGPLPTMSWLCWPRR